MAVSELELSDGISDIAGLDAFRRANVTVRFNRVPVGDVTCEVNRGFCRAETLRQAIARDLVTRLVDRLAVEAAERPPSSADTIGELLGRPPAGRDAGSLGITVAVCTRDRPVSLASCLKGLRGLDPAPRELLVVDNAPSTNATARVVSDFPGVSYVREATPGLDNARNCAIREASGDVLAFLDDDVLPDPDWVGALGSLFTSNGEVDAITGLVRPLDLTTEAQWLFEQYGGFGRGYARRWHAARPRSRSIALGDGNTGKLGTGANMAFRLARLRAIGGFDPALDTGTPTQGGGDLEMFFRLLKGGSMIAYEPAAFVKHRHRESYEELREQIEHWGTGMSAYLARTAEHFPEERIPIRLLRGWLGAAWFAKRYLFSYARQTFPRELIVREMRGSLRGATLYASAKTQAGDRDRPAGSREDRAPRTSRAGSRTAESNLDLNDPAASIAGLGDAERLALRVNIGRRSLGVMPIAVHQGMVGHNRLRDAVAGRFRTELLGATEDEARRRVDAWLVSSTRGGS